MFEDVKAKKVFSFFEEISSIPRGSGNEAGIADYLEKFAVERGLFYIRDKANNIFMRKGATEGYESHAPIMLQGHIDMVCEADSGVKHDFLRDPIKLVREGDALSADGTTLGADNGVAVSVMLALLDSTEIRHPTLECLFTSGEEVGMTGMKAFDTTPVTSRRLINLDSSTEGVATVSCAGGVRTDFSSKYKTIDAAADSSSYKLTVTGLAGGHSGEDINLGRTNAIVAAVRILLHIAEVTDVYLYSAAGGDKDNAIPRECVVELAVSDPEKAENAFRRASALIRSELVEADQGFRAEFSVVNALSPVLSADDSHRLISTLSMIYSGPIRMFAQMPEFVETSSNFSIIRIGGGKAEFTTFSRSSSEAELDDVVTKLNSIAYIGGIEICHRNRYTGWAYDEKSEMRELYLKSFRELFGKEGRVEGTHAGVECGVLKSKIPELDVVSIGAEIRNLHSPSETVFVSSFDRFFELVAHMLENS